MEKRWVWHGLFWIVIFVSGADGGPGAEYTLRTGQLDGTPVLGRVGAEVPVSTWLDFPNGDPLTGFSYGICHDAAIVAVDGVREGVDVAAVNNGTGPGFFSPATPNTPEPGYTLGVVIDLFAADTLAPKSNSELAVATYSCLAVGETALDFCLTGSPIVLLSLGILGGGEVIPATEGGALSVADVAPGSEYTVITGRPDGAPAECALGGTVDVGTFLSFPDGQPVTGFSYGVCHDPSLVTLDCVGGPPNDCVVNGVITPGSDLGSVNSGAGPDFFAPAAVTLPEPGYTLGVVINLLGTGFLPPMAHAELAVASYRGLAIGNSPLILCETGSPLVFVSVVTVAGNPGPPTLKPGVLRVVEPGTDPDYTLIAGALDGSASECAVGGTVSVSTYLDFPKGAAAAGFSYGLCHDPQIVSIDCTGGFPNDCMKEGIIVPGRDLAALNNGEGPDFFAPGSTEVPLPGYTLGVVISFVGSDFLAATTHAELARATYRGLAIGTSPLMPCETGDPVVFLRVGIAGGGQIAPTPQGGILEVTSELFQRGDTNMDGAVDISDAVFLARHIFVSSADFPITCRDAADVDNNDGNLGLPDVIRILQALLSAGVAIEPPFGACGTDNVNPDCEAFDPDACP